MKEKVPDETSTTATESSECDVVWELITDTANATSATAKSAKSRLKELGVSTPDHLRYLGQQ